MIIEAEQFQIWNLENQENQWCNFDDERANGVSPNLRTEDRSSSSNNQAERQQVLPSCAFLFYSNPQKGWLWKMLDLLDHRKSKRVPEKHLLLLYWLCQSLCVDHNKLWKILKEMGILDHLACLLRNLYAGQEATVRTGHGTTDWFQIGKE